jgi:hypothetical protein
MRKLLVSLAAALTLVTGLTGAALAAGWFWNAKLDIEGVPTRTVWSVTDDPGGADSYKARIRVFVPRDADATVVSQLTGAEQVQIAESKGLDCREDGVEVAASLRVVPVKGADGSAVQFDLVAHDTLIASATGKVRDAIGVSGFLATAESPSCWAGS